MSNKVNITIRNGNLFCLNCGKETTITYPVGVSKIIEMSEYFHILHNECKLEWKQPIPDKYLSEQERADFWVKYGEHGTSSKLMWNVLNGKAFFRQIEIGHPNDPDDFKRCYFLIRDFVPEWKDKLFKMKNVSSTWTNIVNNWDELSIMMEELLLGKENNMSEFMEQIGC